jgi:hypothetical protein
MTGKDVTGWVMGLTVVRSYDFKAPKFFHSEENERSDNWSLSFGHKTRKIAKSGS